MKKSKRRQNAEANLKTNGLQLCKVFNEVTRMPKDWQLVFRPGRAISDYDGGGWHYEYDSVAVMIPPGKPNAGCLRHDVAFPAGLDVCSGYRRSELGGDAEWAQVLLAACWELREWVLEIGIPGVRESDLSAKLWHG